MHAQTVDTRPLLPPPTWPGYEAGCCRTCNVYSEARLETSTAPVFKLADLAHLYMSRMEQLGVVSDTRVNTTRLKQRLLAHFPDY